MTSSSKTSPAVEYKAPNKGIKGTVTIPSQVKIKGVTYKVTSVGASAFKNNTKITKVIIGKNVTKIGTKAFYKCTSLKSLTISGKVKYIGKYAFAYCKKLKSVTVKTTKLTGNSVGTNAFKGIYSKAVIKVPKSKLKYYTKLLKKRGISSKAKKKKNRTYI